MVNNLKNIREKKNLSVIKMAEITGIGRDIIYKMEKGEIGISKKNLKIIQDTLNITASEIYGGVSNMIPIKYYPDILASAGKGCFVNSDSFEIISIDEKQLKEMGINSNYQDISVIKVDGSSMIPTLVNGDLLFVDTTKKSVYNNKIYISI